MNLTQLAALSDERLMSRLATGNMDALGELYVRYDAMVKSAVRRVSPGCTNEEMEDLTQEIFLAVEKSVKKYKEQMKFKSWLYAIAVRKTRHFRRYSLVRSNFKNRSKSEKVAMAWSINISPEHVTDVRKKAAGALRLLPEKQRQVLVLSAVNGFSGEEIAQILGISPNTVWTRINRARKTIFENGKMFQDEKLSDGEPS